ncbi:hypothetical protein [uncultured Jatrophihabitans sp.]|uniref:hypothetical protein n=1 Tax=uncultured Jatrophihabitans sp. TaxID=1610747 RepID=UPI0035CA546F
MTTISTARRAVATVAAGAAIAAFAGVASADAAVPHHGKIYFVIGGGTTHPTALMHGVLNAVGKDDPNHDNYDILAFAHGSFRIVHPESLSKFVPHINHKTCYVSFVESGKFHLTHGHGQYAGITGSGTYTATGAGFTPRTKSGACNLNAQPIGEIFTVHAHGTLK